MKFFNILHKLLLCAIFSCICSLSAFAEVSCPSGYVAVNEDAVYVSASGSCPSGHTQLGGEYGGDSIINCIGGLEQGAEVCTFFETACQPGKYFDGTSFQTCLPGAYCDGTGTAMPGTSGCSVTCPAGTTSDAGATECVFPPEFTITTTDTSDFRFTISAAGTYYLDCGNGTGVRTINKTTTSDETFTCANRAGNKIGLAGQATGYSTSNYTAAISFSGNAKIKSVDGSLGAIFGGSAEYMFYGTFRGCTSLTEIPENLFAGISGSAKYMFNQTFRNCTSLTEIPENLFAGVSGSADYMFDSTFMNCTSLTEIPEKLFMGVEGSAQRMFIDTFADCTSLTEIPEKLFDGVKGNAEGMFIDTFYNCTSLTEIPGNLFAGVSGNAGRMFYGTFMDCASLTEIPENLFAGISGSADYMFGLTFRGCASLTEIPEKLFAGISGSSYHMFSQTFYNCTSLKSIPENLFDGVKGNAEYMFYYTFYNCTSLKSIPANLFAGVSGSAENVFDQTFRNCTGLRGYIPPTTFQSSPVLSVSTMSGTFDNTGLDTFCPSGMYQYITGFESEWSGKVSCAPCPAGTTSDAGATECVFPPEFTITTTDTSDFSFTISAAGTYYLDCGNGTGVRTINKTTTSEETFTCVNRTGNTIGLAGQATGYTTSNNTAVISFSGNTKIKSVDGSLGAIFGGSAYSMFSSTFADCTSLTEIPDNLFAGVSGSADYMFYSTFRGCTSLTSIPEKLFTGVSDSAYSMFSSTFADCTSLTEIPEKLFAGVSGNAPEMFYMTFANCTSLTTIYGNLFSYIEDGTAVGVSGVSDSMFQGTFENCESLTEIPENLFAGIQNSAYRAFAFTFAGCTSLESIPGKLFANIQDAADEMFSRTFRGCTSVKTITGDLFNSIYGWAPESAFQGTFADCESLESIPKDIFVNITGSSDRGFLGVFAGCKSLKELPDGLFKNITYASDSGAFEKAFYGCTNLSGYVPVNMFQNLSAEYFESSTMENIFSDTGLDAVCPSGMYQYITGFESAWSGKVSCASCPDGTTSDVGSTDKSQCVSSVKLHIGDDAVLNLLPTRPTTSPVMVFQVGDTQYYAPTSNTETPVNSGTNTKYRILYEDTDYWVHDYTVQ